MHIPIAQSSPGNVENDAVLASGTIARGPVTAAFEEEFAACCGVHLYGQPCDAGATICPVHPNVTDSARAYVCETINGVI